MSIYIKNVDIMNPLSEQIEVDRMLNDLARIPRWCGAGQLSVLQHMMHVARLLEIEGAPKMTVLAGLVHDLHEYVTGDIQAPLLEVLHVHVGSLSMPMWQIQERIQIAIEKRLNIHLVGDYDIAVDRADKLAREQELALNDPLADLPGFLRGQIMRRTPDESVAMYRRGLKQLGVEL